MAASDNLLAYYLFDEATGEVRVDRTGNGYDMVDVTGTDVALDAAAKFSAGSIVNPVGQNDRGLEIVNANLPATWPGESSSNDWTIYLVGMFDGGSGGDDYILSRGTSGAGPRVRNTTSTTHKATIEDALTTAHEITFSVTGGVWYVLVLRYQGATDNEFSAWVDGVKDAETHTPTIATTNNDFYLLTTTGVGGANYGGKVNELAVWDRALTDDEIVELSSVGIEKFLATTSGPSFATGDRGSGGEFVTGGNRVAGGSRTAGGGRTAGGSLVTGGRPTGGRGGRR